MKRLAILLLALIFPYSAHGWSECGHHIVAIMAFDLMSEAQQRELIRVLRAHPNFDVDFKPPNGAANDRFLIGTAGYWPDIARRYPEWNRPTWHYQLGSTMNIGDVSDVPSFPGDLPTDANLETQELYIAQALELCRKIISDQSTSDQDKAIALCWICHLVGDSHQPCHAGSLYVETVFPEGDRGANSINTKQGRNMHALWDGLLGQRYDEGDIRRRIEEIRGDAALVVEAGFAVTTADSLSPLKWLEESREAARAYVYAAEVMEPISVALRSNATEVATLDLSDDYLKRAGRVARLRAMQAAFRLARLLQELSTASQVSTAKPLLIAHRGGVVDSERIENNTSAIDEAVRRGYFMLEVDIRESKDGHLVVHHDDNFSRYYGDSRRVSEMTWEEISELKSTTGALRPLTFDAFCTLCRGRITLMLDTKGPDHSKDFFRKMEETLLVNDLLESAFVIGTQQSKDYFRGKARIGGNRDEISQAVASREDVSKGYFLFGHGRDIDEETVKFARQHDVPVVPSINIFHYNADQHEALAAADIQRMKDLGVTYFQIDSAYDKFLTK